MKCFPRFTSWQTSKCALTGLFTLVFISVNWHVLTAEFKPVRILTDKHTLFHSYQNIRSSLMSFSWVVFFSIGKNVSWISMRTGPFWKICWVNVKSALLDAWILKHIALKTENWENQTPLKTDRRGPTGIQFGQVWLYSRFSNKKLWLRRNSFSGFINQSHFRWSSHLVAWLPDNWRKPINLLQTVYWSSIVCLTRLLVCYCCMFW